MTMLLSFCMSNWRVMGIVALIAGIALQTHRLSNAEEKIVVIQTQYQAQIDANNAARRTVEIQSTLTLEKINHDHQTVVDTAQKNAVAGYIKRYGSMAHVCGSDSVRVPVKPYPAASTGQSGGASIGDAAEPAPVDAGCASGFLDDAARAAVMIDELHRFVRGNPLVIEVEGE